MPSKSWTNEGTDLSWVSMQAGAPRTTFLPMCTTHTVPVKDASCLDFLADLLGDCASKQKPQEVVSDTMSHIPPLGLRSTVRRPRRKAAAASAGRSTWIIFAATYNNERAPPWLSKTSLTS